MYKKTTARTIFSSRGVMMMKEVYDKRKKASIKGDIHTEEIT